MNQSPASPMSAGLQTPRTPESVATNVGRYAIAFVRIALWTVLAFVTGAVVFVAVRGVIWAVGNVCKAIGV